MYFVQNNFAASFNVINEWTFNSTIGNNFVYLSQPVTVDKGQFVLYNQTTSKIAIDKAGNATFSDLAWLSPFWSKLSATSNWRFYLTALTNFTIYQSTFNIVHCYQAIGFFNLSITFASSNKTFIQSVQVTDCKLSFFYLKKLINLNLNTFKSKKFGFNYVKFRKYLGQDYKLQFSYLFNK